MFRSKKQSEKQVERKNNSTSTLPTTHTEWTAAVMKPRRDRVMLYLDNQDKLTPKQLHGSIKRYWLMAIALNVGALLFMVNGMYTTVTKNLENPVKLVRVDGKFIEESRDERRRILVDNVIKRVELQKQQAATSQQGEQK